MTSSGKAAAVALGLAALIWFSFGQSRAYPFVNFDDPEYVYEVPEINHGLTIEGLRWAFTHVPSPNWYPLTNISHMVEAQFFGMNAGAYHVTNVLLHAATAILLFLVLFYMTSVAGTGGAGPDRDLRSRLQSLWPSAFVAAMFAIHPLRAESVMWITERKDVLSGLFFVLTIGAYVRYTRRPTVAGYSLMSILFVCGLMSKPMVVTLPIVLLVLDYWPLNRGQRSAVRSQKSGIGSLVREKIFLFALAAASAIITSLGGMRFRVSSEQVALSSRIANALVSYVICLWQMVWPTKLAVFYPQREYALWQVLLAAAFLVVVTFAAIRLRKSRPYFFIGWLWYVVMMLPVIGLVQVNLQGHADRYSYLPQIGLGIAIAWGIADLSSGSIFIRRLASAAAIFAVLFLSWITRVQAATWKDSETLWRHAISVTTGNFFAHASLADLLLRQGKTDEAIVHAQEALRIRPTDADAENNLGLALLQKGNIAAAADHFERCLAINPDQMNGQANLAWILATAPDGSMRNGERAVALASHLVQRSGHPNAIVLRTLAAAYAEAGRFSDAITTAQQGLDLANANGDSVMAADLRANLESYRINQPLRMR